MAAGTGARVVVVGAGPAAHALAWALRDAGHTGPVTLLGEEPHLPYERPPLSKHLGSDLDLDTVLLAGADAYRRRDVTVATADPVTDVEVDAHRVHTAAGHVVPYDHLVLATGAGPRPLPAAVDVGGDGQQVHLVRSLGSAQRLRAAITQHSEVVVLGGGFLGLELAATARAAGAGVRVVEASPALVAGRLSETVVRRVAAQHERYGVELRTGDPVTSVSAPVGGRSTVTTRSGWRARADVVVAAVGARPRADLARAAGIACGDGIRVDPTLHTSAPDVWAIGDCADVVRPDGTTHRVESVPNARAQATTLARTLTGSPTVFSTVPWFWSCQFGLTVQITGDPGAADTTVILGDPDGDAFSVHGFRDGVLVGVESIGRPGDQLAARRLLARTDGVARDLVAASDYDLRRVLSAA